MARQPVTIHEPEALRQALLHVTAADLTELAAWVPQGTQELVRVLGARLAVRLLNTWPGAKLRIPAAQSALPSGMRRRAELVAVLGDADAQAVCSAWCGEAITVPVCRSLLGEKRRRWLRSAFDELTRASHDGHERSKAEAIYQLGLRLSAAGLAMSSRQIEAALDNPGQAADDRQADLFTVSPD